MRDQAKKERSRREGRLIEWLREHPQLQERIEVIVDLSGRKEGPVPTADEVEEQLIEAIRQLGQTTMETWAGEAERRIGEEFKAQHPGSYGGKKKSLGGGASTEKSG